MRSHTTYLLIYNANEGTNLVQLSTGLYYSKAFYLWAGIAWYPDLESPGVGCAQLATSRNNLQGRFAEPVPVSISLLVLTP